MAFSKSTFNSGMVGLKLERFHWKPFDKDSMDVTVTVFYRHVISFYPPAQLPLAQSIAGAISPLRSLIFPHSPLFQKLASSLEGKSKLLSTTNLLNSGMRLSLCGWLCTDIRIIELGSDFGGFYPHTMCCSRKIAR